MVTATRLKHSQELFLLFIVEQELNATDAYAKAYPRCKPASVPACVTKLLKIDKVQNRLDQLKREKALAIRAASLITVDFITKELQAVARNATADKQHSAASQALMGIAKIHGMLVDKQVIDMIVRKPSAQPLGPDEMSEAQWLQEYSPLSIDLQPEDEPKQNDG